MYSSLAGTLPLKPSVGSEPDPTSPAVETRIQFTRSGEVTFQTLRFTKIELGAGGSPTCIADHLSSLTSAHMLPSAASALTVLGTVRLAAVNRKDTNPVHMSVTNCTHGFDANTLYGTST